MTEYVEVQQLLGNRVRDGGGRVLGRIESIVAETVGPRCVVQEYNLGAAAFLSRIGMDAARLFGFSPHPKLLRVPWKQMDLSDPKHPRLRCTAEELQALQSALPPYENEGPPKRPAGSD